MRRFFLLNRTLALGLSWAWLSLYCCLFCFNPNLSLANPCLTSAAFAAREIGVPQDVLIAIAKTETGRSRNGQFAPWPWTINVEGKGTWFETRTELLDAALVHLASGKTLFDLGCFQINYKWHQENFDSLDVMIDPKENARYAAKFLKSLHKEFGDWTVAAGAYHSRTQTLAEAYLAKFERHLASAESQPDTAPRQSNRSPNRENSYPFLQTNQVRARMGSLVPIRVE